jgi:enamine deaminase RidA (YjgF/YER057c/UK114 family)
MTIRRLAEEERLSGAVVHGGLVWLAGQVAEDASLVSHPVLWTIGSAMRRA